MLKDHPLSHRAVLMESVAPRCVEKRGRVKTVFKMVQPDLKLLEYCRDGEK